MGDEIASGEVQAEALPGRVVLVLQGGGALGAFQLGVFEALEEAGIRPDWVIGTSIGALNGALIAGNRPEDRLARLAEFWDGMSRPDLRGLLDLWPGAARAWVRFEALTRGVPGLFAPGVFAPDLHAPVGAERAAFYSTAPLRERLEALVDLALLNAGAPRLTVGAVNLETGRMRYFDSAEMTLGLDHLLASGALPPAFPAVRIDDALYWDGGVYSNTPIEAVFAETRRRSSVVFAVQLWNAEGEAPRSIWEAMSRQKDIQYASRAESHLLWQAELHHLRHVVRELEKRLPPALAADPEVQDLVSNGCATTMHLVRLIAPALEGDDMMKDVDFAVSRVAGRREAGRAAARRMIARAPWRTPIDPRIGVAVHDDHGG